MSLGKKYEINSIRETVQTKDMWAGAHEPDTYDTLVLQSDKLINETVIYSPAYVKCFDELYVNAIDQYVRMMNDAEKNNTVSYIKIDVLDDGTMIFENDGQSVEVAKHPETGVYIAEQIFATEFQGSNKHKSADDTTGGVNGIGAKIASFQSKKFGIKIKDHNYKKSYDTEWLDGATVRPAPKVKSYSGKKSMTQITFQPEWKYFGGQPANMDTLRKLFLIRVISGYIYIDHLQSKKAKCTVSFCGKVLDLSWCKRVFGIYSKKDSFFSDYIAPDYAGAKLSAKLKAVKFNSIYVSIVPRIGVDRLCSINGLFVKSTNVIDELLNQIIDCVKLSIVKTLQNVKFQKNYITDAVTIVLFASVPSAAIAQDSQSKDTTKVKSGVSKLYKIPNVAIKKIVKSVRDKVLSQAFTKIESQANNALKTERIDLPDSKYVRAIKKGNDATLIIAEGDSAMSQIRQAVSKLYGYNKIGILSAQGNIINARQQSKVLNDGQAIPNNKLKNNEFFKYFALIMGITEYTKAKPDKLNYGKIICCVDQDLDGIGKIFSLFLNMVHFYWPWMFRAKMIFRFETPIQRAIPSGIKGKTKAISFYYDTQYREWERSVSNAGKYKIHYYKGLGTHSAKESEAMFKYLFENAYLYTFTDLCNDIFYKHYGKETEYRKEFLRREFITIPKSEIDKRMKSKEIEIASHYQYEVIEFQKDDLVRKLSNVIDGQNRSRRKILNGILCAFGSKNERKKVDQLGGYISDTQKYHHGETSLKNTIVNMAQFYVGGTQLPFIIPHSQFGTRFAGGKDHAATRYIFCSMNKKLVSLMFPKEDYYLLKFVFDEGHRCEPEYFVPVLPLALLETTELPSYGWKNSKWSRDVFSVINYVRIMLITGSEPNFILPLNTLGWKGKYIQCPSCEYTFGMFKKVQPNKIIITELPLGVWINPFTEAITDKPWLISINNKSSNEEIHIECKVSAEVMDFSDEKIMQLFGLAKTHHSHLNMYGTSGEVMELKKYRQIISFWFKERLALYEKRLERLIAIARARIAYYEEILRYIPISHGYRGIALAKIRADLEAKKYKKFNAELLSNPEFMPTAEFKIKVYEGSYNYLLNLTDTKKSKEGIEAFGEKLAKSKDSLKELLQYTPQKMFLQELHDLEEVIREGIKTGWTYGNDDIDYD